MTGVLSNLLTASETGGSSFLERYRNRFFTVLLIAQLFSTLFFLLVFEFQPRIVTYLLYGSLATAVMFLGSLMIGWNGDRLSLIYTLWCPTVVLAGYTGALVTGAESVKTLSHLGIYAGIGVYGWMLIATLLTSAWTVLAVGIIGFLSINLGFWLDPTQPIVSRVSIRVWFYIPLGGMALYLFRGMYGRALGELRHLRNTLDERVKRRTEQAREARERAKRANREKNELLETISHEVRTHLNSIIGHATLIGDRGLDTAEQAIVSKLNDATKALSELVDTLIDVSRIKSGEYDVHPQPMNPRETMDKIQTVFDGKYGDSSVTFELNIHDDVPETVEFDDLALKQILYNLLENGIRYTNEGSVSCEIQWTPDNDKKGELTCVVSDTGAGMTESERKRIMNRFERGDGEDGDGYGLGLAIVERLVTSLDGSLEINSTPGEGTTVRVRFSDVRRTDPADTMVKDVTSRAVFGNQLINQSVLVVDDDEDARFILEEYLSRMGAKVTTVPDGETGLERGREQSFDLVLADVRMPGMGGYQFLDEFRDREPDTPVLAVTAHASTTELEQLKQATFAGVLTKPVHPDDLLEVIRPMVDNGDNEESEHPSEAPATIDRERLSAALVESDVDELLNEFRDVKQHRDIPGIKELAEDLVQLGERTGNQIISNFGDQLIGAVNNHRFQRVDQLLDTLESVEQELD